MLRTPYSPARISVRRWMFVLLSLLLAVTFVACGASDGPQAVAQRFADKIVAEDYKGAAQELDTETNQDNGVSHFLLPMMHASLESEHGNLQGAVARDPIISDSTSTVSIIWRLERADVATTWELARTEQGWKIVNVKNDEVVGQLDRSGTMITPTPTIAPTGTPVPPTPTPSTRALVVQVADVEQLADSIRGQILVTLVERDEALPLRFGNNVSFPNVSLGNYTLRVQVPGRADSETKVEVRGDQPLPQPLILQLGEALPADPNNTVLLQNDYGRYTLATISSEGLTELQSLEIAKLHGWDESGKSILFTNNQGLGRLDVSGQVSWNWELPDSLDNWWFRPDGQEIAYISNRDIFTLATKPGAQPERWTELGIFKRVLGWIDNDTLLIEAEGEQQVRRRDGSSYTFGNGGFSDPTPVYDREYRTAWLQQNSMYFYPGQDKLEERITITGSVSNIPYAYGWTSDNQYYLLHSHDREVGEASGIIALGQDGSVRQIAPELLAAQSVFVNYGDLSERLVASAFAPVGSQLAVAWAAEEQSGIYVVDAATGTTERISDVVPQALFWPKPDTLVYIINEGDKLGTWLQPVNGGPAQQLFAYRAKQVTGTPDGRLLLIANDTLWQYDGQGKPQILGNEGGQDAMFRFVWPKQAGKRAAGPTPTAGTSTSRATTSAAKLEPARVLASGSAPPSQDGQGKTVTYEPEQAIDGQRDTAWRIEGEGERHWLMLEFDTPVTLHEVRILPGYAKVDPNDGSDRFKQNRRVARARLEFLDGEQVPASFEDAPELQSVKFKPEATTFVRIVIEATYEPSATDGRDFTPIDEVEVFGQPCTEELCGTVESDLQAISQIGEPSIQDTATTSKVGALYGDYARVDVTSHDPAIDSVVVYLKRENGQWKGVTAGTWFTQEGLTKLGIPDRVWGRVAFDY